jgi:hypothetical protein
VFKITKKTVYAKELKKKIPGKQGEGGLVDWVNGLLLTGFGGSLTENTECAEKT